MLLIKKANKIFKTFDNKIVLKLTFISFFSMVLEIVGILSIIPFLTVILDKTKIDFYSEKFNNYIEIKNYSYDDILIFFLSIIFVAFILKSFFLYILNLLNLKIAFDLKKKLTQLMCKGILLNNYDFHLKNNTSKLFYHTLSVTDQFVSGYVLSLSALFSELVVIVGLFLLLLFIEPTGTLVTIFSLIGFMSIIYILQKKKLKNLSVSRYENEKKLIKNFNEILFGIKDIILFNKKKYFFDNFQRSNSLANENILNFHVCQSIPRLMLELVGILVLILFVIFMLIIEKADSSRVISTISIFGLCSFRFIPSVNRIILASQNIKFSSKNVHELFDISENFELYNKLNFFNDLKNINFRESILLKNIKFLYDKKIILNNLNFVIPKNSIIGIYGESGSGKTTLVNIISGLIKPTNGEIWIDNQKINFEDILKSNLFSYLHQEPIILEDTLKKNIAFGETESQIYDERVKLVIDQAQLNNFVNSLDDGMNTLIGERGVKISGGQKQRIGIARALYYKRQVLILDKSTNALDLATENRIYKILYELKSLITTIIISHRFNSNHKLTKKFKILNGNLVEY